VPPLRCRVVDIARRDDTESALRREGGEHVVVAAVERATVVDEFHHDVVLPEQVDEAVDLARGRCGAIADPADQGLAHPPLAASGEHGPGTARACREVLEVIAGSTLLSARERRGGDGTREAVVSL